MQRSNERGIQVLQLFPPEKLAEFKYMTLRARLRWLEEANAFVKKALFFPAERPVTEEQKMGRSRGRRSLP